MGDVDLRLKGYFAIVSHYRMATPEVRASMLKGTLPNHRDHARIPGVVERIGRILQTEGGPDSDPGVGSDLA